MNNGAPKYKRILLKVTGEVFAGPQDFGIDGNAIKAFAQEIKEVKEMGCDLAMVVGGIFFAARWRVRSAWTAPARTPWACWRP
ncbi:MAG: uridylate kinase [Deltaproteobacteria bacterium]|nr:uridylate kinase [Deltaproteobacteria bacterium]